ncbi:sulfatase-like hydrolase/transferase [Maribellus comscasis]|uniref:Sulfatase-like hydrolase/transferase n=1 Tax=Maribellus comscasis TaxID=2681766 RepID=A0A6I6JUM3_9BACT|nr:sulfatase [Maribellus comscasis]QGY46766.1 sulfatase-like hydrolase/transferase [Maribellus comscasis]
MIAARLFFYVSAISICFVSCQPEKEEQPNVLFIAVDDLRTELGCYGNTQIKSPNIDKLASEGLAFNRAYCQQPICMASRASLMSGLRPDTLQIYNCLSLEEDAPGILTIDQHFENNGYKIWAAGKIYHHGTDYEVQFGDAYHTVKTEQIGRGYLSEDAIKIVKEYEEWYQKNRNQSGGGRGPAFEWPDVPDNAYEDGKMTDMAIKKLADFKSADGPFFMAVGYKKPHLPFNAPKKYWELYDAGEIDAADNPYHPENVSRFFNYNFGELRNYSGIPKGATAFNDTLNKTLKHGYYACISYIDAQIGRLLDGLKENGLEKNTIVILWGDHGWKLGEHGMWCKHTQFHIDNHVPLLLKVPGQTAAKTDALVEFVDIFPSLCELAGLEKPGHLQGTSFAPLVQTPDKKWKEAALSYWPVSNRTDPEKVVMGYTVQTDRYRYTEWIRKSTGELLARDLFDHHTDPQENNSIANDPENEELMQNLSRLLNKGKGWKGITTRLKEKS